MRHELQKRQKNLGNDVNFDVTLSVESTKIESIDQVYFNMKSTERKKRE